MENQSEIIRLEKYFTDTEVGNYIGLSYKGDICTNLRTALKRLGFRTNSGKEFDHVLENAILQFQIDYKHENQDGFFGPGTRKLLAKILLNEIGQEIFDDLIDFSGKNPQTLFISYAWNDTDQVNKIDQWLRDNGIKVKRDITDFIPGNQINEEIERAIIGSDKVLIVYSESSKNRDWPKFEQSIAERIEKDKRNSFIVYLVLDNVSLPKHDCNRIAIHAKGKMLKEVGNEILRSILNKKAEPPRYIIDPEERF
jgi:hypothetical protein